jgi:DNA-binding response OmpR family regulator
MPILIVMLTARSLETDEVRPFSLGADVYVTNLFRIQLLIHRVRALLRRSTRIDEECRVLTLHGIE